MTPDVRLAVPAAAGWMAAAIAVGVPEFALPAAIVAWACGGALVLLRPRLALVALVVALCLTSVAANDAARRPADLIEAAEKRSSIELVLVTTQTVRDGSFDAVVSGSGVPVRVIGAGASERVGIGASLVLTAAVVLADPGDQAAFLLFPRGSPRVGEPPPWWLSWADSLRTRFLAAATALPGDGGDLLAGLAIGDTSAVSASLQADMTSASLTHLTAVSGANCAVVVGLVLLLGAALGVRRGVRIALAAVVLVAFVVLVTPEPSVLRAAVMALLVLGALCTGRPVQGLPILALAVVGLLVADPWLARSFGFVLSVLATAGLLLLASPIARRLERWLPRWLALMIAVPVSAQITCQPVIILLNASLPTYGVVANMLAEPAAPIATVVGLAACVALVVVPPVGQLLCAVAWLPSAWIAAVARFFGGAPLAQLPWPDGLLGVVLAVMVSAAVIAALRWRWMVLALALCAVVYLGALGGSRVGQLVSRPSDWQYAACDVGQGDAFLVRSGGEVMLVDTGPDPALLTACLDDLGIARVDVLVLTHWDADHVGGIDAVVGRATRVLVGPPDDTAPLLIGRLTAGGALVEQAGAGLAGSIGTLDWTVLWPPARGSLEPGNDASVALRIGCVSECLSGLFLGDLGESAQSRLPPLDPVDVVKVAHHGSADQSARSYEQASAAVGLIGVGLGNDYGHPTSTLLETLAAVGTAAVRTDESGLILVAPGSEPGSATVWSER